MTTAGRFGMDQTGLVASERKDWAMRVLVCGGRDFSDRDAVFNALDRVHRKHGIDAVIDGHASGADRCGGDWATARGIESVKFPAEWDRYGKSAGFRRNRQMLELGRPDVVVAFPGGRGTAEMVALAAAAGVTVWQPMAAPAIRKPRVLNRAVHGFPEGAINIMRPTIWGNRFVTGKHGTRAEVIAQHREELMASPELLARLPELRGHDLVCCCALLACHGDIYLELANRLPEQRQAAEISTAGRERSGLTGDVPGGAMEAGMTTDIFVFGSNLAGRHGKGAALFARQHHGAVYGQGIGRQGNSYAIPTKDERLQVLDIDTIGKFVDRFISYAVDHPELRFQVTAIGTGLAGYRHDQIAPLFDRAKALPNVTMPSEWMASSRQLG